MVSSPKKKIKQLCAICQTSISPDESQTTCPGCQSTFHTECWNENGGCGIYGCENAPKNTKKSLQPPQQRTYWGKRTKVCPLCGERINVNELRCPFCGEQFASIDPISSSEIRNRLLRRPKRIQEAKGAIAIFIFGLLGIFAPFNLLFGGIWYHQNRIKLQQGSPIHNLLAIVGLALSGLYCLLIIFGILLS